MYKIEGWIRIKTIPPQLDPKEIKQLGFVISEKQVKNFHL